MEKMFKIKAETLVDALADTLAEDEPETLSEYWPM